MKLIFVNCNAIHNWHLDFLGQVCVYLQLHHCWCISDVSMLGQVQELMVVECPLVNAIEGLGGRRQTWVWLENLPITSAWPVRLVPCVTIERCEQLRNLEGFGEKPGQTLRLEHLPIKDFSDLKGRALGSMQVTNCNEIESAAGLEDCGVVSLNYMRKLHDVSALCNVSRVTIISCPELRGLWRRGERRGQCVTLYNLPITDVDGLAGVSSLALSACNRVRYIHALADVRHLRVLNCHWLEDTAP